MASSNTTENFGLNQWLGSDMVLREDFNSDNVKIDEAIYSLMPATGTYTGIATTFTNTSSDQEINLGFYPSAVLVMPSALPSPSSTVFYANLFYSTRDLAFMGSTTYSYVPFVEITETGFTVRSYANIQPGLSTSSVSLFGVYHYFAWR